MLRVGNFITANDKGIVPLVSQESCMIRMVIILTETALLRQVPWFLYSCFIFQKVFLLLSINLLQVLRKITNTIVFRKQKGDWS